MNRPYGVNGGNGGNGGPRWHRPQQQHGHFDRESEKADAPGLMTESEYLQRLAREMKPVVVHLRSGEKFRGSIEYFDQRFIRLTRPGEPNLFIFKHDIKYFYEE